MEQKEKERAEVRHYPLIGQLDAVAVDRQRPDFADVAENEDKDVELDFTRVDFVDSSGIGAVVYMYKRLTARGHTLIISGLNGQPLELFRFLRIDKTIPVVDSGRVEYAETS